MVEVKEYADVCIIGSGAGGPAAALHLLKAGAKVAMLEAGQKFDLDADYTDLPFDMLISKFGWPYERKTLPFMLEFDAAGNPIIAEGQPFPVWIYVDKFSNPIYFGTDYSPVYLAYDENGKPICDAQGNPSFVDQSGESAAPLINPYTGDPVPYFAYAHDPSGMLILPPQEIPAPMNYYDAGQPALKIPVPNKCGPFLTGYGVGGTTLIYHGSHHRAYYHSLDEWDMMYAPLPGFDPANPQDNKKWRYEINPFYTWLEDNLPIKNAPMGFGPFDTNNAIGLAGARHYSGIDENDPDYAFTPQTIPMFEPEIYDPDFVPYGEYDPGGYRGSPNGMTSNCWHCGNCMVGCHKPEGAQIKDKVKRASNVSLIPEAEKIGLDLRPQSNVLAVFYSTKHQEGFPHLVVYGEYSTGYPRPPGTGSIPPSYVLESIKIQPCNIVVFSGGTVETPKLWKQSIFLHANAGFQDPIMDAANEWLNVYWMGTEGVDYTGNYSCLPDNDNIGKNLMNYNFNFIRAVFDKPVMPYIGQVSQVRVEVPGLGHYTPFGFVPSFFAYNAFANDRPSIDYPPDSPYYLPVKKFGKEFKAWTRNYENICHFTIFTEDPPNPQNRIFINPALGTETLAILDPAFPLLEGKLELPVALAQYYPSPETIRRTRMLTKMAIETIQSAAYPNSELNLESVDQGNPDVIPVFACSGTMGMGRIIEMPGGLFFTGVVNTDCQAVKVDENGAPLFDESGNVQTLDGLYIADASVLPNPQGAAHTTMAIGLRTAEAIARKYFLQNDLEWRKWKTKIGDDENLIC